MRYIFSFLLVGFLICNYGISESADPVVSSVMLFEDDDGGTTTSTTQMSPNDEMTLVVEISDGDGFNDIWLIYFYIWDSKNSEMKGTDTPTDHATYYWKEGYWDIYGPLTSTWTIDKEHCTAPATTTISSATQTLKLVFTPGKISRYEEDKNWKIKVEVQSYTGSFGYNEIEISNAYYSEIAIDNKEGYFTSNFASTDDNPLTSPINATIISNATFTIQIKAEDFTGESGTISLPGPLGYALTNTVTAQTTITTTYLSIGTYSITSEEGLTKTTYLWLDYPIGLHSGTYNTQLYLKTNPPGTTSGIEATATLKANIKKPILGSLTFTLAPSTNTAGTNTLFCLTRLDNLSHPMIEGTTTITLSSTSISGIFKLFPDGSGTTTLIIPDGTSTAIFYYYDEKVSALILEARVGTISTSTSISIIPAEPDHLTLLIAPQVAIAGSPSSVFRLQRQDKFNNSTTQNSLSITPYSPDSPGHYEFRLTPEGGSITTFTINDGTSTIDFYYYDESPGIWTIKFAVIGVKSTQTTIRIVEELPLLQEINNSIFPDFVTQGKKNVGFKVSIENLSIIGVTLAKSSSISFSDGANTFTSTLIAETQVSGKGNANLYFNQLNIPSKLTPMTYFVTLSLKGTDTNSQSYSKILVGANKVKVYPPYVTFIPENLPTESKYPGQTHMEILKVWLENSYTSTKTITSIKLTNATQGSGTQANLDSEISRLYLSAGSTTFTSGIATFNNLNISIPPDYGTTTFLITYDLSLKNAKDVDIIDIQLVEVTFATSTSINANFPLNSYGHHIVDGMVSSQITINHIPPANFKSGELDNLVLEIIIPSNGYATDTLSSLSLENAGSADENDIVLKLNIGTDTCLGTMNFTGAMWQKTGLNQPIGTMGLKIFITADIKDTACEGKTIKLRIPTEGIEVLSDNDGPIDKHIENYYSQRIKVHNKVIFEALDLLIKEVHPGDKKLDILSIAMTNYYTEGTQTLTSLTVTNTNVGTGSLTQLDSEIDTLYLYNGTTTIGISNYKNGKAIFSGLNISVGQDETKELKVKYDVALHNTKDDNIIDCSIAAATDISFESGTTSVGGIFPLDSSGFHKIDGLVNAQITNYGAKAITVATGTTNVLVLDVLIPCNGYATDTLTKMRIKNSGTAKDSRDIKTVKLCTDANTYTATWSGEYWEWTGTISIPYPGKRTLIKVDVADKPINGSTIMMKIPVNGLDFLSDNDGPIDSEIINPCVQTISEGLLSSLKLASPKVEIDGTITIIMEVVNTSTEDVHTLTPTALILEGSGNATLTIAPEFHSTLPAGSSTEFIWTYKVASYPGTLTFNGYATSTTISSIPTYSEPLYIQDIPKKLKVSHIPSMPFEVNKGQDDIIPMSIIFENPATATFTGDIAIGTLSFDVGTIPNRAIAKITLTRTGIIYGSKTDIETSGTTTTLKTSIVIPPNQSIAVSLIIEIPTSTTTNRFQISLTDVYAQDVNSYKYIEIIENLPLSSGYAWIKAPSEEIVVGLKNDNVPEYVNKGQSDVLATQIEFVGNLNTSKVEITQLSITINSTNTISKLIIKDDTITYAEKDITSQNPIDIDLFTPIIIYDFKEVDVRVNIVDDPSTCTFGLGSLSVNARDYNTKDTVLIKSGTITSSTPFTIQSKAQKAIVTGTSTIPPKVYRGQMGIKVFELNINNLGTSNTASILLKEVTLNIPQSIGEIIIGDGLGTYSITGTQNLTLLTSATITTQATITFKINILVNASLGEFKLDLLDVKFVDANDFSTIIDTFSTLSAITQIKDKPTGLFVSYQSHIPVNVGKGEKDIHALTLTFTNQGGTNTDEITIGTISLTTSDRFNNPIIPASVLSKLILYYAGTQTSKADIETTGSKIIIRLAPPLKVGVDKSSVMEINMDISSVATSNNFKISLISNVDVEAIDTWNNPVSVGGFFPIRSESATIFNPALENSFTNYPNPFAAGKESTTIAYYLPEDGYVTIKIYTVIGDLVITLLDSNFKSKGMHHEERWDGRNGTGEIVLNGVYFCQIKVNYITGASDKKIRKIAVIR
ncbi:MAG: hypothetical protein AB1567_13220 [bacterium]